MDETSLLPEDFEKIIEDAKNIEYSDFERDIKKSDFVSLILDKKIGGDDKLVFYKNKKEVSKSKNTIGNFFSLVATSHHNLSANEIIRFSHFFNLNFYQTLALLLKSLYEMQNLIKGDTFYFDSFYRIYSEPNKISRELVDGKEYKMVAYPETLINDLFVGKTGVTLSALHEALSTMLTSDKFEFDQKEKIIFKKYRKSIKKAEVKYDPQTIFQYFIEHIEAGNKPNAYTFNIDRTLIVGQIEYEDIDFEDLLKRFTEKNLHLIEYGNPRLSEFIKEELKEFESRKNGTFEEEKNFYIKRNEYLSINIALDESLITVESSRKNNASIKQKYFNTFAKLYSEYEKLNIKKGKLEKLYEFIVTDFKEKTTIPEEKINEYKDKVEKLFLNQEEELLNNKQNKINADITANSGKFEPKVINEEEFSKYISESQKVLKSLRILLHDDLLHNDPAYKVLTDEQKKEIKKFSKEIFQIQRAELDSYNILSFTRYRSLSVLTGLYEKAKLLLIKNGLINFHKALQDDQNIEGSKISEKIKWLEERIKLLKEIKGEVDDENFYLMDEDEDFTKKDTILKSLESISEHKLFLKSEIQILENDIRDLENKLRVEFNIMVSIINL